MQMGRTPHYVSFDTFRWCPLVRCFWGWHDLCHNCDLCNNLGGSAEACHMGLHTPVGAKRLPQLPQLASFRRYYAEIEQQTACRPFALHPLPRNQAERPAVAAAYAPPLPHSSYTGGCAAEDADAIEIEGGGATQDCRCRFQRYPGIDNAAAQRLKPAAGTEPSGWP